MSEGTPWRVCDLKINGRDLKALGYSGRKLGAVLDEMLLLAANGKIENSRDALLDYAAHKKRRNPLIDFGVPAFFLLVRIIAFNYHRSDLLKKI